jgi:hypothetical protein
VEEIGPGASQTKSLQSFSIASGSSHFVVQDGVLFNQNMSVLVGCPASAPAQSYESPDATETIAGYSFALASNLKSVTFSSVKTVEDYALLELTSLSEVIFGTSLKRLGISALQGTGISEIDLPSTLQVIGARCFAKCANLTAVSLPEGLTTVGDSAFSGSGIKSLSSTGSLTYIDPLALSGVSNLSVIRIRGEVGAPLCAAFKAGSLVGASIYLDASAGYHDGQAICDGAFIGQRGCARPNHTGYRSPSHK